MSPAFALSARHAGARCPIRSLLPAALLSVLCLAPLRVTGQATIGEPIFVEEEEATVEKPDAKPTPKAAEPKKPEAKPPPKADPKAPDRKPDPKPAEVVEPPKVEAAPVLAVGARAIAIPTESEETIVARWQEREVLRRDRDFKRADEQEREIERLREALAFDNLFGVATALIREADELVTQGNAAEALKRCEGAVRLASQFPEAHFCVGRTAVAADPSAIGRGISETMTGLSLAMSDLRTGRLVQATEVLTLVLALVLACAALLALLVFRHAGLFLSDFHSLFPKGVPRWQTMLVGVVLIVMPPILGFGVMGSLAGAGVVVAVYLSRAEAIAAAVAFTVLAASHFVAEPLLGGGPLNDVASDVYMLERGEGPLASVLRLRARLDADTADFTTCMALGRFYKRVGRYDEAQRAYEKALARKKSPEAFNNLGNVRFLLGDTNGAQKLYRQANEANDRLAAPNYNIAQLYFREGKLEIGEQAKRAATELGGEEVRMRLGVNDDMRANMYLIDARLTDAEIESVAGAASELSGALSGEALSVVVGRVGATVAALLALGAALLVAGLHFIRGRLRPSWRCPKCGTSVNVRTDPELAEGGLCSQCVTVFVRRAGVDAPDRIRKEIEVRRYRRRERIFVRIGALVFGGSGHVLAGRVVVGSLLLLFTGLLGAHAIAFRGLFPPLHAIDPPLPTWRLASLLLVLLVVYGLSLRNLIRNEEPD